MGHKDDIVDISGGLLKQKLRHSMGTMNKVFSSYIGDVLVKAIIFYHDDHVIFHIYLPEYGFTD